MQKKIRMNEKRKECKKAEQVQRDRMGAKR